MRGCAQQQRRKRAWGESERERETDGSRSEEREREIERQSRGVARVVAQLPSARVRPGKGALLGPRRQRHLGEGLGAESGSCAIKGFRGVCFGDPSRLPDQARSTALPLTRGDVGAVDSSSLARRQRPPRLLSQESSPARSTAQRHGLSRVQAALVDKGEIGGGSTCKPSASL